MYFLIFEKMKHIYSILTIFLLFSYGLTLAQQFNFQNYSVSEGLAQSQVYAMLEDSRGYIWMGTRGGGLSRFDGQDFYTFTTQNGLNNNYIGAICEDKNGNIWIGTDNGISCFNGQHFKNYTLDEAPVHAMIQDQDSTFWLGTNEGIMQFDGKDFHHFSKKNKLPLVRTWAAYIDSHQNIWMAGENGAIKIKGADFEHFTRKKGLNVNDVRDFVEDKNGHIWMGTYSGGVNIYDGKNFKRLMIRDGLGSNLVLDMFKDKEDKIWVGTQNGGVAIWNPADSTLTNLTIDDGLCNNHVRAITQDTWGNIWIGTSGGGVSKYFGQQFTHFDKSNGLKGNYIYAIAEDMRGKIWFSVSNKGLMTYDGNNFAHIGRDSGFLDIKSKAIFIDDKDKTWVGMEGNGVAIRNDSNYQILRTRDGLSGNWIRDIAKDSSNYMWVAAAGGGISRISPKDSTYRIKIKKFTRRDGLRDDRITDLHIRPNQQVWFATRSQGVGYIENDNTIVNFTQKDGLPSNNIRSIVEDSTGYLWLGTAGAGIARIAIQADTLAVNVINHETKLTSNNIYLLVFDDDNNLWAGSETGIDKILLDAERNVKDIVHFGRQEGFVGIETCQNAVLKDRRGNLWFGTINGLTKYNPKTTLKNPIPPKIQIREVRLFYEELSATPYADWLTAWGGLKKGLKLPWNQNHLGFEFFGVNHSNPEKVQYQWKLEGQEDKWSPIKASNEVSYSNLAPGDYTFLVRAYNEDMVTNESAKSISFTILPPFWEKWWFRLSVLSAILLLIIYIVRSRVAKVKKAAQRQQEKLELDKHLIQLEQKALQLQMNPHFIFNALNSIQSLISQKDHKTARYQLAKFSKLMRATLENSRENDIALENEIQVLESYLTLEQFSRDGQFDFYIEIDESIDIEETFIPPMMLQPFVENAIIHGVAHLSNGGEIHIHFSQKNDILECKITDNGIGRTAAHRKKSQIGHRHKSTGLKVTQERLDLLKKKEQKESSLHISDLVLADGTVGGTKVVVRLPIS